MITALKITHCPVAGSLINGICITMCLLFSGCAGTTGEKPVSCCAGVGLYISNLTGESGIDCGLIDTWAFPKNKVEAKKRAAKKAIQCAKNSELTGTPFMLSRDVMLPPDVSYSSIYIYTQTKEKVLLQMGEAGNSGFSVGVSKCVDIHVDEQGEINGVNCTDSPELYEKLLQRC